MIDRVLKTLRTLFSPAPKPKKAAPRRAAAKDSPPAKPKRRSRSRKRPTTVKPIALTKAETAELEPFEGLPLEAIHVPKTPADFLRAAEEILAAGVAGFDTESKPTFRVGEKSTGPHVVQFALRNKAFLFQLHRNGCAAVVSDLLKSEHVLKVGFGLRNDHGQIKSRLGVLPKAVLDLEQVFRKRGYSREIGVRAAIGVMLQQSFPKSKTVTTSNWAAAELTPRQRLYAANDAFAALCVMEALDLDRSAL